MNVNLVTQEDVLALAAELREQRRLLDEIRHALPPRFVGRKGAAHALGVSEQTVDAMLDRGDLVGRRAGRRVLVDVASLRGRTKQEVAALAKEASRR